MKRVLMIAYHYPPVRGSSGVQRTLKFSRYLAESGWEPIILTVHPRAYPQIGTDQLAEIPSGMEVNRSFALDTARHLAFRGAYPNILAYPDRWVSWWLGAMPNGLALIRKFKPELIWSTYPIATAHLIGLGLQRLTGLPWVADFRDSMTEDDYPPDPTTRKVYRWIERHSVMRASKVVFTTPGTQRMYAERYPQLPAARWNCIPNGYDEENFHRAQHQANAEKPPGEQIQLLHSGILYPSERDPRAFFTALAELQADGLISPRTLKITLRATGSDALYTPMLQQHGIGEIVILAPAIDYEAALTEMLVADGLLIFQAANCNHQIPAKLYEYARARRPILALTDPRGDTAQTVRECGIDSIAALDDKDEIKRVLLRFLASIRERHAPVASEEAITCYSRQSQTKELARLFDGLGKSG